MERQCRNVPLFLMPSQAIATAQPTPDRHRLCGGHLCPVRHGQNRTLNEPVRRIPPTFGRITTEYTNKKVFAAIDWTGASAQKRLSAGDKSDHRINPNGTPGWGIVSFRAGYSARNFSIHTGLENILDQEYRIHGSGIDGYGRMVWMKLSIAY